MSMHWCAAASCTCRFTWTTLMTCCGMSRRVPGQSWKCAAGLLGHTSPALLRNRSGSTKRRFVLCFVHVCDISSTFHFLPSLPFLRHTSYKVYTWYPGVALHTCDCTALLMTAEAISALGHNQQLAPIHTMTNCWTLRSYITQNCPHQGKAYSV